MEQSNLDGNPFWGTFGLASFIPYMNAYLFTLFQILPLLFLVPTLGSREEKIDSLDTIYYRPESNAEYVWGISLGFTRAFLSVGGVSLMIAMMIHLLGSDAPFDILIYLFYLVTLIFPTFIFSFGFCLFVKCYVGHRLLSLALLVLYFVVILFYVGDVQGGLYEPTGVTLPNAFSEMTGHPNVMSYLLHRGGGLLLGLGLIQFTVVGFNRLLNHPENRSKRIYEAVSFLVVGVGFIGIFGMINNEKFLDRRLYSETYNKYAAISKGTLISQTIDYKQLEGQMEVGTRLVVRNQTGKEIPKIVLYLNPGLQVLSLLANEENISFVRENQVIIMNRSLLSNDSIEVHLTYRGKINENICYLDVPDKTVCDTGNRRHLTCRFGKKYAFLDEHFTLLTPEVLWYPVTEPPINIKEPHEVERNFTRYQLRVLSPEKKMVISQGRRERENGTIVFYNEHPLPSISLCIGDYETRTVMVDSITCELHVFKRHPSFFNIIGSCHNSSLEEAKQEIEQKMGRSYPFTRLSIIETPISFTSYFKSEREGSEFIQPELVFLPERFTGKVRVTSRGYDGVSYTEPKIDLVDNLRGMLINDNDSPVYDSWIASIYAGRNLEQVFLDATRFKNNPYYISPLILGHVTSFHSDNYPVMNTISRFILDEDVYDRYNKIGLLKVTEMDAIDYLACRSLKDALSDQGLSQDILSEILALKSHEIMNYFNYKGIPLDSLRTFIFQYMNDHLFQVIDFDQFNIVFQDKFGCDWTRMLFTWYNKKEIPVYLIKDFSVKRVDALEGGNSSKTLVQFSIFNDSDVDGIVSLQSSNVPHNSGFLAGLSGSDEEPVTISYFIKARTGKKVSLVIPNSQCFFKLNLNICQNYPRQIEALNEMNGDINDFQEYIHPIGKDEFDLKSNEIVVDNEDSGFRIKQNSPKAFLQNYLTRRADSKVKYENLYSLVFLGDTWKILVDNNAYGYINKSAVFRSAGSGKSTLEWSTELMEEGKYELFAHIPVPSNMNILGKFVTIGNGEQEYTIVFSNKENKKVVLNTIEENGWVSLGRFSCVSGESKVVLSDTGKKDQLLIGDAIKWVYLGKE